MKTQKITNNYHLYNNVKYYNSIIHRIQNYFGILTVFVIQNLANLLKYRYLKEKVSKCMSN